VPSAAMQGLSLAGSVTQLASTSLETSLVPSRVTTGASLTSRGSAGGLADCGRAATRGSHDDRTRILITRPPTLEKKTGYSGAPITLDSNFFAVKYNPDWKLYQYQVSFTPEEDHFKIRKRLMRDVETKLGPIVFDGGALAWAVQKFKEDPVMCSRFTRQENQIQVQTPVEVRLIVTNEIFPSDGQYLQVLNIILRRAMDGLKLDRVKRSMFDSASAHKVRSKCGPGYIIVCLSVGDAQAGGMARVRHEHHAMREAAHDQ